jgi:hypothetical protein
LVASLCLLFKNSNLALWIFFGGLGIMTLIQIIRVLIILRKRSLSRGK